MEIIQKHQLSEIIDSNKFKSLVAVKGWPIFGDDGSYVLIVVHEKEKGKDYPNLSMLFTQKNAVRTFKTLDSVSQTLNAVQWSVEDYLFFSAVNGLG